MPLQYMNASIVGVNLLGTAIRFPVPGITNYDGRELFVKTTVENIAGVDTLRVKINEIGPSSFAPQTANALPVLLDLTFGTPGAGASTPYTVNSRGGPLQLTASVVPSANPWGGPNPADQSLVTLNVVPAVVPNITATPIGYVIVLADQGSETGSYQLRWIQHPVQRANSPAQAEFIPDNPNRIGIAGPFGIQTP
jgi:hypothetical protein